MPFTPLHMGPGLLLKAILQSSFSLMVFGWTQIVMDVQPLIAILTGTGQLHGFTHTYIGATLIALVTAVTGKYLAEFVLRWVARETSVAWTIAVSSAFVGSYSHVILDSLMHADMTPLYPFSPLNSALGVISASALHQLCVYSGLLGIVLYVVLYVVRTKQRP